MKKTKSNTSKKAIRYLAVATGLTVAALPNKANAGLLNIDASVNVPGLVDVGAGVDVGNGVGVRAGAKVLGVGAGVDVRALSAPTYAPAYEYATPTYPARRVAYTAPATTYVPETRYVVANPDVVYRSIRPAVTYRPTPVVYATAPVVTSGERVEVETYDSYSHETDGSSYNHVIQKRLVEDTRYREEKVHSRKVIRTRRFVPVYGD